MNRLGVRINGKLRHFSIREAWAPGKGVSVVAEKRAVIGRLWPWLLSFGAVVGVVAYLWRQS